MYKKTLIINPGAMMQLSGNRHGGFPAWDNPRFCEAGMALKSTIFKADLQLADLDRAHFGDYALTLARHPSETDERLMIRLLAFALHASESLVFGRGLSTEDEADLWDIDPTGAIARWIDVGLPDEKAIRRACGRAREVVVLAYGGRAVEVWWQQLAGKVAGVRNLRILALSADEAAALGQLAERTMRLQCTIQEGMVWLGGGNGDLALSPKVLFASDSA